MLELIPSGEAVGYARHAIYAYRKNNCCLNRYTRTLRLDKERATRATRVA